MIIITTSEKLQAAVTEGVKPLVAQVLHARTLAVAATDIAKEKAAALEVVEARNLLLQEAVQMLFAVIERYGLPESSYAVRYARAVLDGPTKQ